VEAAMKANFVLIREIALDPSRTQVSLTDGSGQGVRALPDLA
jgi:hypothetical protein